MTKRVIILFFLITIALIVFHGLYRIYEIFYPSYFTQTGYNQIAFIGNKELLTKNELLFYGFKDLKVLLISSLCSFLMIFCFKLIRRKKLDY